MADQFKPPVSFAGKHKRDLQYQSRESGYLVVLMPGERIEASNILC
jgi:hypothetical protein